MKLQTVKVSLLTMAICLGTASNDASAYTYGTVPYPGAIDMYAVGVTIVNASEGYIKAVEMDTLIQNFWWYGYDYCYALNTTGSGTGCGTAASLFRSSYPDPDWYLGDSIHIFIEDDVNAFAEGSGFVVYW